MLYVAILALSVVLIAVSVKLAQSARELRALKSTMAGMVTVDAAIAAADRQFERGLAKGEQRALRAAEDAVAARAAAAARKQFRNATK